MKLKNELEMITMKKFINYKKMCEYVNNLSDDELDKIIEENGCPYQTELIPEGVPPFGMHHCPVCGEMVLSLVKHPRQKEED